MLPSHCMPHSFENFQEILEFKCPITLSNSYIVMIKFDEDFSDVNTTSKVSSPLKNPIKSSSITNHSS